MTSGPGSARRAAYCLTTVVSIRCGLSFCATPYSTPVTAHITITAPTTATITTITTKPQTPSQTKTTTKKTSEATFQAASTDESKIESRSVPNHSKERIPSCLLSITGIVISGFCNCHNHFPCYRTQQTNRKTLQINDSRSCSLALLDAAGLTVDTSHKQRFGRASRLREISCLLHKFGHRANLFVSSADAFVP